MEQLLDAYEINITTIYQIIGYLVFLVIIQLLMKKPFLKILEERDRRINGRREGGRKDRGRYPERPGRL